MYLKVILLRLLVSVSCLSFYLAVIFSATFPKPGQIVSIHYTGMFENGTKFDSSRDRGKPFKFQLGKDQVLKGWEEGLSKMSLGQRVRLICPPEVAYGKRGYPGVIPANATLIFDMELLKLE